MPKQLQVINGPELGRVIPIPESDTLLIGRSRALEVRLADPYISRVHCQVQVDGGQVLLTDFESAAGTFVNGKRITQQPLVPGDIVRVGETFLRFYDGKLTEQTTLTLKEPAPGPTLVPGQGQMADLVGQTLVHYQVGPVLARGQSGLVFHARDTRTDTPVALKVLWPQVAADEEDMQRFVRAMRAALPLRHPNLVALYGAGKTGPYCWAAMEYVDGESLIQVIQRIGTAGMLDWRTALRVAVHVARALEFAHQNQVIHRNVTPMNILVQSGTGQAKLGDLMLAKALEGALAQPVTRPGELVGNVAYLSPERTREGQAVDGRSDFYSLGATVYALLTGRPPFEAETLVETVTKIRQEEPVRPKKYQLAIPDMFEGVVLRMLAKRPEDRFQKAGDMLAELERVAKYQGLAV